MPGHETQLPALREGRKDEAQLGPRKLVADAAALPPAKWQIGERRKRCLELRRPSLGREPLRFGIPAGVPLDDVGTEEPSINHYGTKINFFKQFILKLFGGGLCRHH